MSEVLGCVDQCDMTFWNRKGRGVQFFQALLSSFLADQGYPHAAGELRSGARKPARASLGANERHGH